MTAEVADRVVWSVMGEHFELPKRFTVLDYRGAGAYGVVCAAEDSRGEMSAVAIKKCKSIFQSKTLLKRALREIKLLRTLQHPNVVKCLSVLEPYTIDFTSMYVVFELMETDLASIIRSDQVLSNKHIRYFTIQLLRACEFMHSSNIIHRDLKPRNLLVNEDCTLKVADFGLARVTSTGTKKFGVVAMTEYVTTRWYRAPEILLATGSYDECIDLWAVGCILAELIGRVPIFPGNNSARQVALICNVLGVPDERYIASLRKPSSQELLRELPSSTPRHFQELYPSAHPLALDVLRKLLCWDHSSRLTADHALKMQYFEQFSKEKIDPVSTAQLSESFSFENIKVDSLDFFKDEILKEIDQYRHFNCKGVAIRGIDAADDDGQTSNGIESVHDHVEEEKEAAADDEKDDDLVATSALDNDLPQPTPKADENKNEKKNETETSNASDMKESEISNDGMVGGVSSAAEMVESDNETIPATDTGGIASVSETSLPSSTVDDTDVTTAHAGEIVEKNETIFAFAGGMCGSPLTKVDQGISSSPPSRVATPVEDTTNSENLKREDARPAESPGQMCVLM
jgi:serine/threonine protein kinase